MRRSLSPGVVLGIVAIVLAMAGSATAGVLITTGTIKDGTIQSRDIRKGGINLDRLAPSVRAAIAKAGQVGPKGDTGLSGTTLQGSAPQKGDKGEKGDKGDSGPVLSSGHWGIINRNTIGSPNASLRSGPFTPPVGTGALNLSVPNGTEKVAYGNEIDFAGRNVSSLTRVGFYVYNVGENGGGNNMPGITFEIDPNLADPAVNTDYSSLVFMPDSSVANQWSPYIDATTSGKWGLTGGKFNSPATQDNCGINGPRCTWTQMMAYLNDGGDPAKILSVAVTKGRDNAWQGAVDGLTLSNVVYDFEEFGVLAHTS